MSINLTRRELEVLALVVSGKHNWEIAQEFSISVKTVETHVYRIYQKLGVSNRAQAIKYALIHGIIELKKDEEANDAVPKGKEM